LTSDASAIRCAPPFMRPETAPPGFGGGTMIAKGLRACKQVLTQRDEGDRMIILVSDGVGFDLPGNDAEVAKEMKAANIAIYSIHISDERVPDEIANVCGLTGGEVFDPEDPETLRTVFQRIDQMAKAPLEKSIAEMKDWFFPYCVAGLVLLGFCTLASFGLRYTPW
jgi:Ca-activated chloride channel family protein